MTDEERILWHHLWRIPLEGTHFRKQAPGGRFYVDFVSHRLRLVVELDGAQHGFEAQAKHDRLRDSWLEENGYRVLRFWNHEVKKELDSVLDTIYAAVEERSAHLPLDGGGRSAGIAGSVSRRSGESIEGDAGGAGGGEPYEPVTPPRR